MLGGVLPSVFNGKKIHEALRKSIGYCAKKNDLTLGSVPCGFVYL